eukprot:239238-Amphidinium_carterae.1
MGGVRINGSDGKPVTQVLMDSLASLPLWPLRIDFDTGHNHEVSKYFDYHPVGFTIKKHGHVDKVRFPIGKTVTNTHVVFHTMNIKLFSTD